MTNRHARAAEAATDPFAEIAQQYDTKTRVLITRYCGECHSTEKQAGELDLQQFQSLTDVRKQTKVWLKVVEMLDTNEMPPADADQPSESEKKQLRDWLQRFLDAEALANAGDPGPVVLRRLSNAEYNYTIHDLTAVDLSPAREFPVDSAAGEGFTNTGNALVMSPSMLTKYLDAGKEISRHAVPLPDGFRFSTSTTPSDWTNETLAEIRALYGLYSETRDGSDVNLQGIVFNTNDRGQLPLEKYLSATLIDREALQAGTKTVAEVAAAHQLNAKYLGLLWDALNAPESSALLSAVRDRWKRATVADAPALAAQIRQWQQVLWQFHSVGHIGKVNGPRAWQEPIMPLAARQDLKLPLVGAPDQAEVKAWLAATDAGDGAADDVVIWQQPRLTAAGRPDLLLRDVRAFDRAIREYRQELVAATGPALNAAAEVLAANDSPDLTTLAQKHGIKPEVLQGWLDFLGIGPIQNLQVDLLGTQQKGIGGYEFVNGWGAPDLPSLTTNASDTHVRVPGNMKPHAVCVHPSPNLSVAVGWRSPVAGELRITGQVTHAHPECGNGVTWALVLRRGTTQQRLAAGVAQGGAPVTIPTVEKLLVQRGDLISLVIGPRDANHSCDLTDLELVLTSSGDEPREWNLSKEIAGDILAGNPQADQFNHPAVWHFYTEPVAGKDAGTSIAAGSLLARWQMEKDAQQRQALSKTIHQLLNDGPAAIAGATDADVALYQQLRSLSGPLLVRAWPQVLARVKENHQPPASGDDQIGLDPALFGHHLDGSAIDPASLCVQAPRVLELRLPAELASGAELVTGAMLAEGPAAEGSVQLQLLAAPPGDLTLKPGVPVVTQPGSSAHARFEAAFKDFQSLFPAALCYTKIVPTDEVVTLTLYHREDEPLRRLMLNEQETARLDRLWEELHFISHDALTLVDAFAQLMEYATQDADPSVFEPLRQPILDRAAAFSQQLVEAEPLQLDAVVKFAERAYRRPLTEKEATDLRDLYQQLRQQDLTHDEAWRFTIARIFVTPAFLYRLEKAPAGTAPRPISDLELASRLSYFLWASQPDDELLAIAAKGKLHEPEVMQQQMRRMLADPRTRRLATEFACQWLHVYDFESLDEKSETRFPEFAELRGEMYEETIRFFTDLFQQDASILSVLNADHVFVNERLADFYGIPGICGTDWQRVEGAGQYGRGGILGLATTLSKQSGASRTSPILRGNWVSEMLLGERLPRPPKDVPVLPDDDGATAELTERELTARHVSDSRCATCHKWIDPFGFSLENYDAIGRYRQVDTAKRPIDSKTVLPDGKEIEGMPGLRDYLLEARRDAVVRQFCRKLLGYSLGRGVQLSDEPLLKEMQSELKKQDYRFSVAVNAILQSRQFREIRGKDAQFAEAP